ncbi:divergent polysaccharide deacetylase family protein [Acetobacter conturbans]|uniref:divergent polysaccharide deacetylase family protein n=1 Tax=Acetobacter conturbans TaxID=1737472 RepID=UPI00156A6DAB
MFTASGEPVVASLWQRLPPNGRLFVRFWGGVSVTALLFAIGLQEWSGLHPKKPLPSSSSSAQQTANAQTSPPVLAETTPPAQQEGTTQDAAASDVVPGVAPIPAPIQDMLEAVPGDAGHSLPKRGPKGEQARDVYAAAVPTIPPGNARVAILLDGFGLSEDMSLNAARSLPAPVSFAVPAYAPARTSLSEVARKRGHEIFIALPMQPSTAPMDDEGPRALGYDHTIEVDKDNLEWALSRFDGYVGATNAFSGLDGDAYAQSPDFAMVSHELEDRGLLYLNATPGTQRIGPVMEGDASLTMDTDTDAAGVDGQLEHLVAMAKAKGSAVAVAGPMRPVLLQRLAEWAATLNSQGVSLVPVSSLCHNTGGNPGVSPGQPLHIAPVPQSSAPPSAEKVGTASGTRAVSETPLAAPGSSTASPGSGSSSR